MTDYNDGQPHIWHGGECPVHPKTEVTIWYRAYRQSITRECAGKLDWSHENASHDIIAFQVTKPFVEPQPPAEPKEIWVNEYEGGGDIGTAWPTEGKARANASIHHTSIAVPYRKVMGDE